jgi:hypothetical protein
MKRIYRVSIELASTCYGTRVLEVRLHVYVGAARRTISDGDSVAPLRENRSDFSRFCRIYIP